MSHYIAEEPPAPKTWRSAPGDLSGTFEYARYKTLLLGALGVLARRGYPVYPDDGVDLIHDFFSEAWSPVVMRYDPTRAKFETYVFGTFVHFARPRIIRTYRRREVLLSIQAKYYDSPEVAAESRQEVAVDVKAVQWATDMLPDDERTLLAAYLSDSSSTERELASRFQLSRYRLRALLADALGHAAVNLGEYSNFPEPDLSIVQAVWRDGMSTRETSRHLRISATEIQAARERLYYRLVAALKGNRHVLTMNEFLVAHDDRAESPLRNAEMLLSAAMLPTASDADLAALAEASEIVTAFLESASAENFLERNRSCMTPDILARLYDTLGFGDRMGSDVLADVAPFLSALEQEERNIVVAFEQILLPYLPNRLTRFADEIFLGNPTVSPADRNHLLSTATMAGSGPKTRELATFGITPVKVVQAVQAVADVARRTCRAAGIGLGGQLVLEANNAGQAPPGQGALSRLDATREIVATTNLSLATSDRLLGWLVEVAAFIPALFGGFDVETTYGGNLRLRRTDVTNDDLSVRWRREPQVAAG